MKLLSSLSSFLVQRSIRSLFIGVVVLGSLGFVWLANPSQTHAAMRAGVDTILVLHGFNGDSYGSGGGFDCQGHNDYEMGYIVDYLNQAHDINGQQLTWQRKDFRTLQYYNGDYNCSNGTNGSDSPNLHANEYKSHCTSYYPDGTNANNDGTNNESIYHLSCLFAWYVYNNFASHNPGWNIEIVAHSMGGLIVRNAIYQVVNRAYLRTGNLFPSTLGNISDVVTFGTPHGGIDLGRSVSGFFATCGSCTQLNEMHSNSNFIQEMATSRAQNPQATSSRGTDWTLMGSDCDEAVGWDSATYMKYGHSSVFDLIDENCYLHAGYLKDTQDDYYAYIDWCDGCSALPPNRNSWHTLNAAPHSLHHMMYALWLSNW